MPLLYCIIYAEANKLATGESLLAYLHRYRLEIAKELLRSSSLTIQEMAYQVGYENISYFYNIFRTHTSVSPKAYREDRQSSAPKE